MKTNQTMIRQLNLQTCQWEMVVAPTAETVFHDAEVERLERRQWERDGWGDARWDRQRF